MAKRAVYTGGHDAVEIQPWRLDANGVAIGDERLVTVKRGEVTPDDLPDHFVESLLEQATWEEYAPTKTKTPDPTPSAPEADTKE